MTVPPEGAAAVIATVAVEFAPPTTVDGDSEMPSRPGGLIVSWAVWLVACVPVPIEAVIGAITVSATADVEIVNVALAVPAGTVTVEGTDALGDVVESQPISYPSLRSSVIGF